MLDIKNYRIIDYLEQQPFYYLKQQSFDQNSQEELKTLGKYIESHRDLIASEDFKNYYQNPLPNMKLRLQMEGKVEFTRDHKDNFDRKAQRLGKIMWALIVLATPFFCYYYYGGHSPLCWIVPGFEVLAFGFLVYEACQVMVASMRYTIDDEASTKEKEGQIFLLRMLMPWDCLFPARQDRREEVHPKDAPYFMNERNQLYCYKMLKEFIDYTLPESQRFHQLMDQFVKDKAAGFGICIDCKSKKLRWNSFAEFCQEKKVNVTATTGFNARPGLGPEDLKLYTEYCTQYSGEILTEEEKYLYIPKKYTQILESYQRHDEPLEELKGEKLFLIGFERSCQEKMGKEFQKFLTSEQLQAHQGYCQEWKDGIDIEMANWW